MAFDTLSDSYDRKYPPRCPRDDSKCTFDSPIEPTQTFGSFSFTTAKSIDIAWDVIAGRGGQWLLGCITYKASLAGLVHVMESSPVSYELYASLAFRGNTATTLIALYKRVFSTRKYLPRMIWLCYSVGYIIAFPTLMAALTGYSSIWESKIILKGSADHMLFDEFLGNCTVISNSTKVSNSTRVGNDTHLVDNSDIDNAVDVWFKHDLPDYWLEYKGQTYDQEFFQDSDKHCYSVPGTGYGYGFSVPIWIAVSFLQIVWSYGTYGLWVDANRKGQLNQTGRNLGTYRAVIDLGEALAEDLGTKTCGYPEGKLERALRKHPGLRYYQDSIGSHLHIGISSRGHEGGRVDLRVMEDTEGGLGVSGRH